MKKREYASPQLKKTIIVLRGALAVSIYGINEKYDTNPTFEDPEEEDGEDMDW